MELRADLYTAPGHRGEKARIRTRQGLSYSKAALLAQSCPSVFAMSSWDLGTGHLYIQEGPEGTSK